ncbi:choice-of-anchor I family protein [Ectothiorhodospira mobilis]|uniref:choice-of-anchor I family protein n=1 Tax=Ectothiorhodospira mobilis TaxID=195064 RepID=UPI001EE85A7F|nr:choice-of-anchor I family protein [Ectothiorhodospira mobilis]MCG5536829.1 choice-of-anchor I family protein [Ectothiorhodospira mobilis]
MRLKPTVWAMSALLAGAALATGCSDSDDDERDEAQTQQSIELSVLGRYESGLFDEGAAEIVTYDPDTRRAFVVNAYSGQVDILDLNDPVFPQKIATIDVSTYGASANSVAVQDGVVAVAVEASQVGDPGQVAFFDTDGNALSSVQVGFLPDAVTFSPDGHHVLVANEGEPSDDYANDPVGSISIIDMGNGALNLGQGDVVEANFDAFNGQEETLRAQGVRIFGPGASAAQDFEPEWIAVTGDSATAYAGLQENNAIAVVDIATATVKDILPLGFKDWSEAGEWSGNGFDASNRDGEIRIRHWPVQGIFQPDSFKVYETGGETYLVTANEGDARDYDTWSEEARIKDLQLDPTTFTDAATLQLEENLGRLHVTTTLGVNNDCDPSDPATNPEIDCVYNALYAYGGRSMSIFRVADTGLDLVFDTGSQMEETVAEDLPQYFNANNDENNSFDARSDDKGPEPEGITLGEVDGRTYAFVGLERVGGVMVYDITEPEDTRFVQYLNPRDFTLPDTPESLVTTDLAPEGLHFISAAQTPDAQGRPLLLVGHEVSGSTTVFAIEWASSED